MAVTLRSKTKQAVEEISRFGGVGYDYIKFGFRFVPHFEYISGKQVPE